MPYHRTSGVVLRCTDYSESSQVAAILTPDLGQIHALAKGTRRPRKDGRGALDLLTHRGRHGAVHAAFRIFS